MARLVPIVAMGDAGRQVRLIEQRLSVLCISGRAVPVACNSGHASPAAAEPLGYEYRISIYSSIETYQIS
jgi:hypothetical protein